MAAQTVYAVADLRAYLAGGWRLRRGITDFDAGKTARFEGEACFTPDIAGLIYRETGRVTLDDAVFRASRVYLYRFPEPARAEVEFEDGRAFHGLDFSAGQCLARHRCPPDSYQGSFRAEDAGTWFSRWRIEGPRKNQLIETAYRRDPSASPQVL